MSQDLVSLRKPWKFIDGLLRDTQRPSKENQAHREDFQPDARMGSPVRAGGVGGHRRVDALGHWGDLRGVGFARHRLLPRGDATVAREPGHVRGRRNRR